MVLANDGNAIFECKSDSAMRCGASEETVTKPRGKKTLRCLNCSNCLVHSLLIFGIVGQR